MASTNPARGMRDFLPADVRKRNYVIGIIKEVYESYGFEPLETPAIENLETLTGKYGEEGGQLIFKILKRGEKLLESLSSVDSLGRLEADLDSDDLSKARKSSETFLSDLALRYDLTVPLARVVANNKNELPKFFKRYQIQPVWRADRPARGRFREFYQCDVDCIGSESLVVEAEVVSAVIKVLENLGFVDFVVSINDRRLLFQMLDWAQIPSELQNIAITEIDKLDKQSPDAVFAGLKSRGITTNSVTLLADLYNKMVSVWEGQREVNETLLGAVCPGDLDIKTNLLKMVRSVDDNRVVFQPFLARGLSYYTGAIMEINVKDLAGSLGGGGRYDGLIGMFGKEQIPACGFSLGLERILVVMEERGMFPPEIAESTPADVMVTIWNDETVGESLKLAAELRAAGIRTTVYPEPDKLGKQFKYADSIKVPWVCVVGESEVAENTVTLKDLSTSEQNTYPRADIASQIKGK